MLERQNIRIPKTRYVRPNDIEILEKKFADIEFPLITKPVDGTHGDGVALGIDDFTELRKALDYTFQTGTPKAILQEQISGDDHRIIVVGGKVVAAALRTPPYVV